MTTFNIQDAQVLIAAARMSPLQNMETAEKLAGAIKRFTDHCTVLFAPPVLTPVEPPADEPSEKVAE